MARRAATVIPMDTQDAARLEEFESDIAAVASAMETVDRIVAESDGGESAAAEIRAVVSTERFPIESDAQLELQPQSHPEQAPGSRVQPDTP